MPGLMPKGPLGHAVSVYPSGGAFFAASVPMMPPAPGLFSTRKVCPIDLVKESATRRATMSVADPGVKATMILTGLVGYDWANAAPAKASDRQTIGAASFIGGPPGRSPDSRASRSDFPEQDQDDDDDQHQAQRAAGHVAPAAAVRPARHGAQEEQHDDDQQDEAEGRHVFLRLCVGTA